MMNNPTPKIVCLLAFAVLIAVIPAGLIEASPEKTLSETASAVSAPSIFVKETRHNFGVVPEGDIVHHEFTIENHGSAPLLINNVSTNCGCAAAHTSTNTVGPGESARIEVSVNTQGYKRVLTREIYVESNEPRRPRLLLKVTCFVKRDIDVTPSFIYFGNMAAGSTVTKTLRVASVEGTPFVITELRSASPFVHLSEPRKLDGGGYEFDVTIGPVLDPQPIRSGIIIGLESARQPSLAVALLGNVIRPVERAREDVSPPKATDIKISFKLDPRLTRGVYMGDRWVSPPSFTVVQESGETTIEARAQGPDAKGRLVDIKPKWIPMDADKIAVSPDQGHQVKITVRVPGESRLKIESGGLTKILHIKASKRGNAMHVDVTQ